ncbi:VOC family protein [Fluviicola taffensis]|uniref:Glyoxalase/bleomycin resistance protein/dioxygenase n=1 Tax=Fluviicola taffensis (strain DSM 16823 / NCIMB 13979 / RW262) TaxID=755732 RepID=F2IB23_FLUTR|nr:VOC family protein [Fluviicola taffensis]AEA42106.1 glyoxalase/bleomycin resistance protein/dioxygenase [Fluviicola taffensis DSM 16823]
MGKAIGIGGIFFKFKDEKAMRNWYKEALSLNPNDYGVLFAFNGNSNPRGYLQLGTFPENSDYFGDGNQQAMINFRVEGIESLLVHLQTMGTVICDNIETYEYGKFVHILDPEGNRIELWEPVDTSFDEGTRQEMR